MPGDFLFAGDTIILPEAILPIARCISAEARRVPLFYLNCPDQVGLGKADLVRNMPLFGDFSNFLHFHDSASQLLWHYFTTGRGNNATVIVSPQATG